MVRLLGSNGIDTEELFKHNSLIGPYRANSRRSNCRIETENGFWHRSGGVDCLEPGKVSHASIHQLTIAEVEGAGRGPRVHTKPAALAVGREGVDHIEDSIVLFCSGHIVTCHPFAMARTLMRLHWPYRSTFDQPIAYEAPDSQPQRANP